jgi:hypothetical protein
MAKEKKSTNSGANWGFETKLFLTAEKLRGSMDASEYNNERNENKIMHTINYNY